MSTFDIQLDEALDFGSVVYPRNGEHRRLISIVNILRNKLNEGLIEDGRELFGPLVVEIEPTSTTLNVLLRIPKKQSGQILFQVCLGPPLKFNGKPCDDLAKAVLDYCRENRDQLFALREYANRL